jgi:hypothetical protein
MSGVLVGVMAFVLDRRFRQPTADAAVGDRVWLLSLPLGLAWLLAAVLIVVGGLL